MISLDPAGANEFERGEVCGGGEIRDHYDAPVLGSDHRTDGTDERTDGTDELADGSVERADELVSEIVGGNVTPAAGELAPADLHPTAAGQPNAAQGGGSGTEDANASVGGLALPSEVEMSSLAFEKGLICFHDSLGRPFANFP